MAAGEISSPSDSLDPPRPSFSGVSAFRGLFALKGPCTQIVYTLAPKYPYRDYFKAKVYTILGTWTLRVRFINGLVLNPVL